MANGHTALRKPHAFQKSLFVAPRPTPMALDPKGVVYTKSWVVELLLDLADYRPERNLVDALTVEPAAGDGAFLGPMIERLIVSCRLLGRSVLDCGHSLIAYELDVASANRARDLVVKKLTGCGVENSDAEKLASAWVRTGDYLFEASSLEADFVIGNPPYVRLESIPEEMAALYRKSYSTMRGRADLYVAFFEAALLQLKENGVCAFICADRWMRNQYGAELRQLVTSAYSADVVVEMHNAHAFHDEVDAYPAITVIRRKRQEVAVVASAGAEAVKIEPGVLAATLDATRQGKPLALPQGLRTASIERWFKGSDPWPCNSPEQLALLRKLEDKFHALESDAKVGIGVATGNDGVFITTDTGLVERERLLKLALVGDIWSGKLEWSGHYLIDPWDSEGLVDLEKYPQLKAYFEKHGTALKKRHTAKNNKNGWYRTIDRVTHALAAKPKLYIADIKNVLDPVLDQGETYPHHNLYFIQSDKWDLEALGGLLMSAIGQFFVASYGIRMRGGYWRFQAQYLRRIRVPDPKSVSKAHAKEFTEAFRKRDRQRATLAALEVYRITQFELETAIAGY
ncbi:MAG: Eco57I restriction-modification methylase domain-containing protein [Acidobacteriaceae bacterium]|nr:Eco57I restriction-modification methylase domain-containing protein [Acidobacteriaceae bacterium]